jgi:Cupin
MTTPMGVLSESLRGVRPVGAAFINATFTAPWCYRSPSADALAPLLEPGAETVVIYHWVTEGECHVELGAGPPVHLVTGDVVVFSQGHTHLVCGYLACDTHGARMLFAGLPPLLLRVNVRGSNADDWLEASMRYALAEARSRRPGGTGVLAKLAEVPIIEALRLHMNENSEGRTGWLAALSDRIVGAALRALHDRPAQAWTLKELARAAGTSRSVLAERMGSLCSAGFASKSRRAFSTWLKFSEARFLAS